MNERDILENYKQSLQEVDENSQKLRDLTRQVAALMLDGDKKREDIHAKAEETKKDMDKQGDKYLKKLERMSNRRRTG